MTTWVDSAGLIGLVSLVAFAAIAWRTTGIVPSKIRWLAGTTGCVTGAIWFFDFGIGFLSIFLIVGAILAGRFPRIGRVVIWFGAVIASLSVLPLSVWILRLDLGTGLGRGGGDWRVTTGCVATILLVGWCDTALVVQAVRMRQTHGATKS
jgi:hypothetical protein